MLEQSCREARAGRILSVTLEQDGTQSWWSRRTPRAGGEHSSSHSSRMGLAMLEQNGSATRGGPSPSQSSSGAPSLPNRHVRCRIVRNRAHEIHKRLFLRATEERNRILSSARQNPSSSRLSFGSRLAPPFTFALFANLEISRGNAGSRHNNVPLPPRSSRCR